MRNIYFYFSISLLLACNFSLAQGNFTTTGASTSWTSAASWTLTSGTDADGKPDGNDNVTINHTMNSSSNASCKNMTIGASGSLTTGSYDIFINGSFSNLGTVTISGTLWTLNATGTFSSTTPISPSGIWGIVVSPGGGTRTFSAGTVISCSYLTATGNAAGSIVNNGNITLGAASASSFDFITFKNGANGVLTIKKDITLTNGGNLDASANPNTVSYTGANFSTVLASTYHILTIDNGAGVTIGSKKLAGDITVNSAITLASNVQLNCNSKNITCSGTWKNNGGTASNNLSNAGTVTFSGASPTVLRKSIQETFGNVIVNSTGTFKLNSSNTAGYTGNIQVTDLTLTAGTLDMNSTGNYTVTVKGNLAGNGGSVTQNGLIQFTKGAGQTISGATPLTFGDITVSNNSAVSTTSAQNLMGTLTVSSGSFTSNTADFTLLSDNTVSDGSTGRVATLGGSIAGSKWVVKRAIVITGSNGTTPYWDEFSSPVTSSNLSDWDNEMYLSGCGGADGTACCPTFYSVKDWEGTAASTNVTSLVNLTPGKGYDVWTASSLSTFNPFTFDTKGTPNSGTITHNAGAAGYYLMGNPYPSQVQWSLLSKTNLGDYFYILDETISDYATWDQSSAAGTSKLNGSGGVINSSQGFLTEALGAGSLSFLEAAKVNTKTTFVRLAAPREEIQFHFSDGQNQKGMTNRICFADGADNGKDENDMGYPASIPYQKRYVVKTLTLDGKELCKNTLNLEDDAHEVPLVFIPAEQGVFTVSFSGLSDFSLYNCVYLEDISEGKFIDLKGQNSYTFKTKSLDQRNFVLHFKRTNGSAEACIMKSNVFEKVAENTPIAKVFANPSGIVMNFGYKEATKVKVTVYNSMGELVTTTEQYYSEGQFSIERPSAQGIYLVTLNDGKKIETHRIFID